MENLQHQFNRYFVDNGATEWWLTGLKTTLLVTVIALCIGVVLGLPDTSVSGFEKIDGNR